MSLKWKRLTVRNTAVEYELNKLAERGINTLNTKIISFSHRNANLYIILYQEEEPIQQGIDPGARVEPITLNDEFAKLLKGGKKK